MPFNLILNELLVFVKKFINLVRKITDNSICSDVQMQWFYLGRHNHAASLDIFQKNENYFFSITVFVLILKID